MATIHGSIPSSDTLRGRISSPGSMNGTLTGLEKIQGYSAYQVAVINGFEGTEEEWLASLKGEPGEPGKDGEPGSGIDVEYDGTTGTVKFVNSEGGADGRGITSVGYDESTDTLTVHYSDNTSETLVGFGTWMKADAYDPDGTVAAAGGIAEYVDTVKDSLTAEKWTFELEDGTTVTKEVLLK